MPAASSAGSVAKMNGTVMVEVAETEGSWISRIREPGERTRCERVLHVAEKVASKEERVGRVDVDGLLRAIEHDRTAGGMRRIARCQRARGLAAGDARYSQS